MSSFDKLSNILDFVLPVLESQVNIIAQLLNDLLSGCRVTDHLHLLSLKVIDPVLDAFNLLQISGLLISGMEANQSLQYFIPDQVSIFLFDFFLELFDMMVYLRVVISDRLIEADDGFANLFLEITKKPLDHCQHLSLSLKNSFLKFLLFFPFILLMLFHVTRLTIEFFDHFLKERTQIVKNAP